MSGNQIWEKLLECYQEGEPVLLYGKDNIGRKDLILQIHKIVGGIDEEKENFINDGKFKSVKELENRIKELHADKKFPEWSELLARYWQSTIRTFKYVDMGEMNGEEVFVTLMYDAEIVKEFHEHYTKKEIEEMDYINELTLRNGGIPPSFKGHFFACKGLLFLDNLRCNSKNDEDIDYYSRLARIIKDGGTRHDSTTFNWLAVYTHDDPKVFDKYFLERFEPIPLDGEETVVVPEEKQQGREASKSKIDKKL